MAVLEQNTIVKEDLERVATAKLPWSRLARKSVMVTGGSGFLASYLVKSLLAANDLHGLRLQVICVVRSLHNLETRLRAYLEHPNLRVITHDICKPLPADFPAADFIIHSASQASPKYYGVDPVGTLMANTAGTMTLLNHAVKHESEGFMFFSSGEVYGVKIEAEKTITELDYGYIDPMEVRSCYGESKRIGETMCAAWAHQFGLHTTVVRPFHTYGPGVALDDGRVFADFVGDVLAGRNIVLKSDGLSRRPFCYIADATEAFLTVLLKGKKAQAYNVANPEADISMRELAYSLAALYPEKGIGVDFDISEPTAQYLRSPIDRQIPSIKKIIEIGWSPSTPVLDGFSRTIRSFLK